MDHPATDETGSPATATHETASHEAATHETATHDGAGEERRPIGRREWVGLPELGIACLEARMGRGRGSWLWVSQLEVVSPSRRRLRFRIHPLPNDPRTFIEAEAALAAGETESSIRTWVVLGQYLWSVTLGLRTGDESERRAALTLGRDTLGLRYHVDQGASYLAGPPRVVSLGELARAAS